jgi:hypothetical protein
MPAVFRTFSRNSRMAHQEGVNRFLVWKETAKHLALQFQMDNAVILINDLQVSMGSALSTILILGKIGNDSYVGSDNKTLGLTIFQEGFRNFWMQTPVRINHCMSTLCSTNNLTNTPKLTKTLCAMLSQLYTTESWQKHVWISRPTAHRDCTDWQQQEANQIFS